MEKATHFITGRARLSYVTLLQPRPPMDGKGEPKYSVTVLVPKTDTAAKARIDAAIQAAIQQGMTKLWGGVKPPVLFYSIHDGDGQRDNGGDYGPECKGHWVLNTSSRLKPRVVDKNVQDIMDPSEIYSGIYGRVGMDAYPYLRNGKKGVAFGLTNVQKIADGEPLGSIVTAEDDFGTPIPDAGINPMTGLPF